MHGLIFELKKRMNSRQDQPVIFYLFISSYYILFINNIFYSLYNYNYILNYFIYFEIGFIIYMYNTQYILYKCL